MKVQHTLSPLRLQIAKVCHEVNRAYCLSIGDDSQPTWENAPEWQKISALEGVNYYMDNADTTPEDSHKSWLAVKEKDGWVYGEVKDEKEKTHPCMVPYSELPKEQQTKDYLFKAVVDSFLAEYEDVVKK
jgi:hypothetical protein